MTPDKKFRAPRLSRLELRVLGPLWTNGASSIREIQKAFPGRGQPAYTTVQTIVNRLEAKHAVRRVKKIGNAHIFEATVSRASAERRQIDELLCLFGGRAQPLMAYLVESGNLTLEDIKRAEVMLTTRGDSNG